MHFKRGFILLTVNWLLKITIFFQDEHLHKSTFDPLAQHRDWCPWISVGKENMDPGAMDGNGARHQQGWKAALEFLMPMKKNSNSAGNSPSQASQHFTPNQKICMGIHVPSCLVALSNIWHLSRLSFPPGPSRQIEKGVCHIPSVAGILLVISVDCFHPKSHATLSLMNWPAHFLWYWVRGTNFLIIHAIPRICVYIQSVLGGKQSWFCLEANEWVSSLGNMWRMLCGIKVLVFWIIKNWTLAL